MTHYVNSLFSFKCINCSEQVPLEQATYAHLRRIARGSYRTGLVHLEERRGLKTLFDSRLAGQPGPDGSGVRRFREWVLPDLPEEHIVTPERVALLNALASIE